MCVLLTVKPSLFFILYIFLLLFPPHADFQRTVGQERNSDELLQKKGTALCQTAVL